MACKNAVSWLYRLDGNYAWSSGLTVPEDVAFSDKEGKVRLIIERNGRMTVTRGYAWNGCSPKVCVFDLLIGTPDGVVHRDTGRPKTYFASLLHDALYQFLPEGLPVSRRQADDCFFRLLSESEFAPRWLYWGWVRLFGWIVLFGQRAVRQNRGVKLAVADQISQATGSSGS